MIRTITSIPSLLSKVSRKSLFSYAIYKDDAKEVNSNKTRMIRILLSAEKIIFKEYVKFLKTEILLFSLIIHTSFVPDR